MKDGWQQKTLSELCEFQRGLTYGKADEVPVSNNVVLRANNVDLASHSLDLTDLRYISDGVTVPATKKLRKGSLLICTASGSKSHLGKVAYIDEDYGYAFGGFMGQLTPLADVHGRYLFHALTSPAYKKFIDALSDGVNINNLKFDDLRLFPVPIPGPDEQRRVAAILDEAVFSVAAASGNAERNLQNAKDLFEGYLRDIFREPGPTWKQALVDQHIRFIDYRGKTPQKTSEGLRLITAKNVKKGFIQEEPMEFVAPDSYDGWMTRGIPRLGDVLFTTEAPLGNVAQLDTADRVVFAQRIIVMQADQAVLDNTFLKYMLLSEPMQAKLHAQATGATAQGIKASLLKRIPISFPNTLSEQAAIVDRLDSMAEEVGRLEDLYAAKLAALEELKRALLFHAFNGDL